jgi:iron(III) transport system permease protein
LRFISIIIAALCILPIGLVLSSWLVILPDATQANWLHVKETVLTGYVFTTVTLCVGVLALTLPLGVAAAWFVTQYEFRGRKIVQLMLVMPLALPCYISAYTYGEMFDFSGPLQSTLREVTGLEKDEYWFPSMRSTGGAIWVFGFAILPYIYLLACAGFATQSPVWREVAQSVNVGRVRYFWTIALPAARPFIATSAALVLMETLADIGTVGVLGVPTISSGIYRTWTYMNEPLIAARMAGLLLVGIVFLIIIERSSRNHMSYSVSNIQAPQLRIPLEGRGVWYAMLICWLPIIAGFIFPLVYILRMFLFFSNNWLSAALWSNILDTFIACGVTGILVCFFAFTMIIAEREIFIGQKKATWIRFSNIFANLGYAVPGVVIAVGLLILMGWLREMSSIILVGSFAGLFLAFVIRHITIGYNSLHGGSTRISSEMDMAAISLGSTHWNIVTRVYLPQLRVPLYIAFSLIVLDVIKELPLTLILRPFGFKTLAISAYDFASDDRAADSAPFALALILFASFIICLLQFIQNQEKSHARH